MFRSRRRFSTALGAALVIGALSAPAAHAVTAEEFMGGVGGPARPTAHDPSAVGSRTNPAPTVTRTVDEGFDLGSAAIGAGGAVTILLLGGAGATMVARRRRVRLAS
jgi:hypothetical protein